jgi:hypothetical protein
VKASFGRAFTPDNEASPEPFGAVRQRFFFMQKRRGGLRIPLNFKRKGKHKMQMYLFIQETACAANVVLIPAAIMPEASLQLS